METFKVELVTSNLINWIRKWFDENGKDCNAVLGLSGGKDSTIMCALLCSAIGKDRVIGVGMPGEGQNLHDADKIASYFGVKFIEAPIANMEMAFNRQLHTMMTPQAQMNIPPRLRMTMLYAISQCNNGRVVGTTNLSENLLGYFTKFGDGLASDVEPMEMLTVTELLQIGDHLKIPYEWVHKIPTDDLPNSMGDEAKFGFTYEAFDKYIRGIETPSKEIQELMDKRMQNNTFKLKSIEHFEYLP